MNQSGPNQFYKFLKHLVVFVGIFFLADFLVSGVVLHGLNKYYGLGTHPDMLLNGASQMMLGLDKNLIEKQLSIKVAKYTREGVNVVDRETMLRYFLDHDGQTIHTTVYSIDAFLFTGEGLSKNSYTLFYPFMDDKKISAYIYNQSPDRVEFYIHKYVRSTRFDFLLLNSALRGYRNDWSNLKYGTLDALALHRQILGGDVRKIKNDPANLTSFLRAMEMLQADGRAVVLVYFPYAYELEHSDPLRDSTFDIFRDYAQKHPGVRLIDLSSAVGSHSEWYFDPNHLNPLGQKEATQAFIDAFKHKESE